jgi:hypothetical protein
VEAFKAKYGVAYIPSRIILCKYLGDYYTDPAMQNPKSQLHQDSVVYLTAIFKGIKSAWQSRGINWHQAWTNVNKPGTAIEVLEGDQCLVFFLGGIEVNQPNGCVGFSTDLANPDKLGGDRVSFYDFNSGRLVVLPVPARKNSVFFSYIDGYNKGSPYAYFTTYVQDNNYNQYSATTSDCATLGVWPYAEGVIPGAVDPVSKRPIYRYLKPRTFQIISAGADGQFGPGTDLTSKTPYLWTSATAAGIDPRGADDQANFNATALSTGPQ